MKMRIIGAHVTASVKRSSPKIDENRRPGGMLNPLRDKHEGTYVPEGGEGQHLRPRLVEKMHSEIGMKQYN